MTSIKNIKMDPFFDADLIDLSKYPNSRTQSKLADGRIHKIDFRGLDNPIKKELKLYLENLLKKDTAIKYFRARLVNLQQAIDFLGTEENANWLDSLKHPNDRLESEFENYLKSKGIKTRNKAVKESESMTIFRRISSFLLDVFPEPYNFDMDVWELRAMGIDKVRISESDSLRNIRFYRIPNETNRYFLKKYIKYQIEVTDKAMNSIYAKLKNIEQFLTYLDNKSIIEIKREDVVRFIEHLNKRILKNETFNYYILHNSAFMEYLIVTEEIKTNHFYRSNGKAINKKHTYKTIDEIVIKGIFKVLPDIPKQEASMFLLLYSTGMRISDACTIKLGSMLINNNGTFIKYYSRKMRKEVVNPIPESLFKLLEDQEKTIMSNFGDKTEFLFPHNNFKCYPATLYRERMQKWLIELGVKNNDGSSYCFRPHDYRHTLATTMILHDIPSYVIQKIIHHESIEMTSSYIDIQDQQKIQRHKEFINIKGKTMPIHIEEGLEIDDIAKVEWLKKSINAQMLPNGMCSLPVAMGKCPHGNSCLTCTDFRTSKEFLSVHKKHYEKVCNFLTHAEKQGWQRQIETNEEVKINLESIIDRLETI